MITVRWSSYLLAEEMHKKLNINITRKFWSVDRLFDDLYEASAASSLSDVVYYDFL